MAFINADKIAKALPSYPSPGADFEASRLALLRMDELEQGHVDFAVETTLASRSLAPRIARLRRAGYLFRLLFAFLPDAELAVARVAQRVRMGGHNIPTDRIRRRYLAGISNFFRLYQPRADAWYVYDTTMGEEPRLIASGGESLMAIVELPSLWKLMKHIGACNES